MAVKDCIPEIDEAFIIPFEGDFPGGPAPGEDFWVFGYASLIWDPGFEFLELQPALLRGYHRALCIYSHRYRGTPNCPGLVAGLDRGGACRGMAFRIRGELRPGVMKYLWEREMITGVYRAKWLNVQLPNGPVPACCFVCRPEHPQYAGGLTLDETVQLVGQGSGQKGPCVDYVATTVRHLDDMGIKDGPLHKIMDRIRENGA